MTDLFEYAAAHARSTDPDTSHEAAEAVDASHLERITHACLMKYGVQTTIQIGQRTGYPRDSISPRMSDMEERGLVMRVGKSTTKPRCILWMAL